MAEYYVECACGHVEKIQLRGTNKDRKRVADWFKTHLLCDACNLKRFLVEVEKVEAKYGLPQLEGTDEREVKLARITRKDKLVEGLRIWACDRAKCVEYIAKHKGVAMDEARRIYEDYEKRRNKGLADGLKTKKVCQTRFWDENYGYNAAWVVSRVAMIGGWDENEI